MAITADTSVKISPQGYQITNAPENNNPFWGSDDAPGAVYVKSVELVKTTGTDADTYTIRTTNQGDISSDVGAIEVPHAGTGGGISYIELTNVGNVYTLTYTDADGVVQSAGSFTIPDAPTVPVAVSGVTLTNENGIYTLTATKTDGTSTEIGTIDVPEVDVDNLLAEVNDSIVETTEGNYQNDFHTLTETENGGTRNQVGSFYVARKQITGTELAINDDILTMTVHTIDQTGATADEEKNVTLPAGGSGTGTTPDISATASVDDTTGTPAVTVTKTGTTAAPVFDFAFTGLKGETGETGATPAVTGGATVDNTTGTPRVQTTTTVAADKSSSYILFAFTGLKGETGETGATGADGTTPDISATASVDDTTGTPAVTVTKTGTTAAPVFDFAFTGLKGADGSGGSGGGVTFTTGSFTLSAPSTVPFGPHMAYMLFLINGTATYATGAAVAIANNSYNGGDINLTLMYDSYVYFIHGDGDSTLTFTYIGFSSDGTTAPTLPDGSAYVVAS